ncbi:solute carrier family 22 member 6-B-like isoform X2 [Tubulanus polymorphus]|uniref:solute carrier family 22 member 6-B-like isoform X2 n=1 Tax=Tubulanus polymorphus TaxID=672921 RepID=UPI003DA3FCCC
MDTEYIVDEVLTKLGKIGKWQLIVFHLWCIPASMILAFQGYMLVFVAGSPPHHCRVPGTYKPLLPVGEYGHMSQCRMYRNLTIDNSTVTCKDGWIYNKSQYGNTVVTQWDLVCDKAYIAELTMSLFIIGTFIGFMIFGPLLDKFGRRRIYFISQVAVLLAGIATAFSVNVVLYCVCRTITGILSVGVSQSAFLSSCEMIPSTVRAKYNQYQYIWASASMLILGGLAYSLPNWKHLHLALACIPFAFSFGIRFMPESIPWLISEGRIAEAESIVHYAAKLNNIHIEEHPFAACLENDANNLDAYEETDNLLVPRDRLVAVQNKDNSLLDLFKHPLLRRAVIIIFFAWFVNTSIYNAIALNSTDLGIGNRYVSFCVSNLADLPAGLVTFFVLDRYGRRKPMSLFHIMGGISLIIGVNIPASVGNAQLIRNCLTFFGRFCVAAVANIISLFAVEIFPTTHRGSGYCFVLVADGIAACLSPFSIPLHGLYRVRPVI